jgi:hypothetical protein
MNYVRTSRTVAAKMHAVVNQPSKLILHPFTPSPIKSHRLVMSMVNSKSGGVEKPCMMPGYTRIFIGFTPLLAAERSTHAFVGHTGAGAAEDVAAGPSTAATTRSTTSRGSTRDRAWTPRPGKPGDLDRTGMAVHSPGSRPVRKHTFSIARSAVSATTLPMKKEDVVLMHRAPPFTTLFQSRRPDSFTEYCVGVDLIASPNRTR